MANDNLYPPSPSLPRDVFEEFQKIYLHLIALKQQLENGYGLEGTYATELDEVSPTVAYFGEAAIGSLTSDATWRIRKYTTSGVQVSGRWADGNANFDNVWNNRASLSYS